MLNELNMCMLSFLILENNIYFIIAYTFLLKKKVVQSSDTKDLILIQLKGGSTYSLNPQEMLQITYLIIIIYN